MILGGQATISTWVLNEELSIHRKGKSTGTAMQSMRRKNSIRFVALVLMPSSYSSKRLRSAIIPRLKARTRRNKKTRITEDCPMRKYSKEYL